MKIVFTKHAEDKLKSTEAKSLSIDKHAITSVIRKPLVVDKKINPHQSIGKLNDNLSLSVIWKIANTTAKVITFYPAAKDRYESKILRGR